jgi:hypothetical protein
VGDFPRNYSVLFPQLNQGWQKPLLLFEKGTFLVSKRQKELLAIPELN